MPEGTPQPVEAFDPAPILSRLDNVDEAIARVLATSSAGGAQATHELARFDSLGEAFMASTHDAEVRELLHRVLVDQITGDNPGLVPPSWLSTIAGILPAQRPAITAMGGAAPLPATGMEFTWPTYQPGPGPLIGPQAPEKSDIVSAKVSFGAGQSSIGTYAGGSDVSYQLLTRSSPAYRDAYARVMLGEYARVTDAVFVAALVNGQGGSGGGWDALADTTGAAFVAFLFEKSVDIERATGHPATAVLVSTDVFVMLASKTAIVPTSTSTATALGNATASTLSMNVSGLQIVHDANLPASKFIISNSLAARWHEDGPRTVEAEDVAKLGKNIAYWGLGAPALYVPSGIVLATMTTVLGDAARSKKSD